jgi:LemA protein
MNLKTDLAEPKNRNKFELDEYTKAVTDYNTTRNQFPTVITASLFGFKEEPFFKADEGAAKVPDVGDPNAMRRNNNSATAPAAPAANATNNSNK